MDRIRLSDGCHLHVEVLGTGAPVVLVPGLGGSATFWSAIAPLLARDHRVVLFDQRGAGRSDRPEIPYSIDLLASDLIEVLDALDIARAHIVGHSTGGVIGQTLALDYPKRVDRLVLSASWDRPTPHFNALFENRLEVLQRLGPEAYARMTQLIGYPPSWIDANPAMVAEAAAWAASDLSPASVAVARIRMLFDFDRSAELRRITAPTLVIGARDDMIIGYDRARALASAIPGARLVTCEGGHFFPRLDPEGFARHLRFLRGDPT